MKNVMRILLIIPIFFLGYVLQVFNKSELSNNGVSSVDTVFADSTNTSQGVTQVDTSSQGGQGAQGSGG